MGGGAVSGDCVGITGCSVVAGCGVETTGGTAVVEGVPEQEHPAHRWQLGRAFNGGDGSGVASQLRQKSQLELGNCTRLSRFDAHQRA
jgi:hypothetical protein